MHHSWDTFSFHLFKSSTISTINKVFPSLQWSLKVMHRTWISADEEAVVQHKAVSHEASPEIMLRGSKLGKRHKRKSVLSKLATFETGSQWEWEYQWWPGGTHRRPIATQNYTPITFSLSLSSLSFFPSFLLFLRPKKVLQKPNNLYYPHSWHLSKALLHCHRNSFQVSSPNFWCRTNAEILWGINKLSEHFLFYCQ